MPIYTYECPTCKTRFERALPLRLYDQPVSHTCGAQAKKVLTPVAVAVDFAGYQCPATGKWIEGRKAHEENLKRTGCRILESGEREAAIRQRRADDERMDKLIDQEVEHYFETAPPEKLEALTNEVLSGFTPTVERHTLGE